MKNEVLNFGTFNVRGCKEIFQQEILANDLERYNIQICGIQETHIPSNGINELFSNLEGRTRSNYLFYHVNEEKDTHKGVGLIINKDLKPCFKKITDRICQARIDLKNKDLYVISVYAPTSSASKQETEDFYNSLQQTVSKIKSKHLLTILGHFNAKIGGSNNIYPENVGKFTRDQITNSNGEYLLELLATNNLVVTNTLFRHKKAHQTTWTSPGIKENRRNPYRNQIDFIITKKTHKQFIQNSRSYSGTTTNSDHNLVKCDFKLEWFKLKRITQKSKPINVEPHNFKLHSSVSCFL